MLFAIKSDFRKFKIFSCSLGNTAYIKRILSQGWPMMLSQLLIISDAYVLSIFTGSLGNGRLGVEQIIGQYFGLAIVINNNGISESANRIVSQFFGAKKYQDMRQTSLISLKLNISIYLFIVIFYNIFSEKLASVFLDENEGPNNIRELIRYNFLIMTFTNFFSIIQENCRASLTAVNDTAFTSAVSLLTNLGIALPLCALATYILNFDLYGITGSIALSTFASMIGISGYWLKHTREIIITDNKAVTTSNEKLSQFYENKCKKRQGYTRLEESSPDMYEILETKGRQTLSSQSSSSSGFWNRRNDNEENSEKSGCWKRFLGRFI